MSIVRVHYRERQRLSAADMRLEQDYRLGLGGRHDLAHHDWGIVRGLRFVNSGNGVFLLTPGIAIDGYGREIFVPRPLAIDVSGLNQKLCWYVQLYYCEEAQYLPAGQPCGDQPAARIGQRPVVVVTSDFFPPTPSLDDLARARAAGIRDLEPWPVLVATFGKGCNIPGQLIDYALTRYARHRASVVRAPDARAVMQLGLSSRMDFYHFLLSTQDAASSLSKRIGIDRHGIVHIWRPLCISASLAAASVDIGHKLQLHITAPLPAGPGRRVRIDGEVDAQLDKLTTSLRVAGVPSGGSDAYTQLKRESATLAFEDGRIGAVRLFDSTKQQPLNFAQGRRRFRDPAEAAKAFSVQLVSLDARLVLKNVQRSSMATDASPDDIQRMHISTGESNQSAVLFRPAKEIEADPLAREVHAIETSRPGNLVPGTGLRISGGAADDTDEATRVCIGAKIKGNYHCALRMDGSRRIEIGALTESASEPVLKVVHTVYLPPIGARDRLLPELMLLAYIGGLRRIGNVTAAVTLKISGPFRSHYATPEDTSLTYHIEVSSPGNITFTVKRTMELITDEGGKGDLTFRTLELTTGKGTGDIDLPDLRRTEPKAQIIVLMLVEIGQKVRIVVSNALRFDLDNPPH
ncbi:hypothetical protein LJR267_010703 [Paraburkholderia hospita]|uniref:hypothetical protein n=1 Tax=Paraburkholderia hospita TaxID=169430 RepID=UPI003ECEF416